ncbi:transglutaminase domain-containing protein [Tumidithrix elongata RA019]|uniref:Transglutaminase domain-containing protein n=1 Tax=Tumidithrix elongata BACA0141 TaxID=2716417 RepID=A0AAW9Q3F6_9CYAN|nr:transglutaminase domain-containing protein [Tumidithrix elongata RA019]
MKITNLAIVAASIFWGWQMGWWVLAIPFALLIAIAPWTPAKWDFSLRDFRWIAGFCTTILAVIGVYLAIAGQDPYFIYKLLQWLPCIFAPLILAQTYASGESIDLLILVFGQKKTKQFENPDRFQIPLTSLYFALLIVAASAANTRSIFFYLGMFALVALALWSSRAKRFSIGIWLCVLLVAGSVGFVTQIGINNVMNALEQYAIEWYGQQIMRKESDPFKKDTAIGDIGQIKLSSHILFRVAIDKQNVPIRLRESTYNRYQASTWLATNPQFTSLEPNPDRITWQFTPKDIPHSFLTISETSRKNKMLLKLPQGAFQIGQLPVDKLLKNQYGTTEVQGTSGSISYQVQFPLKIESGIELDSSPSNDDLYVPEGEKAALDRIVQELALQGESPKEVLRRVGSFFNRNFRYSLNNSVAKDKRSTALSTFLLNDRSGHCEYFASAAALLLRDVGIPTRYAVGFFVSEFSPLENQYVVRGRDAHAWVLAYINGTWQEFDTTPPDWTSLEKASASQWEFISDLWALLSFKLSEGWQYFTNSDLIKYWWWTILPILLLLRLFNRKKRIGGVKTQKRSLKVTTKQDRMLADSDFTAIEQALNSRGFFRNPSESLKHWLEKIDIGSLNQELGGVVELYYRDRFDPLGITPLEKEHLKVSIKNWVNSLRARAIE